MDKITGRSIQNYFKGVRDNPKAVFGLAHYLQPNPQVYNVERKSTKAYKTKSKWLGKYCRQF